MLFERTYLPRNVKLYTIWKGKLTLVFLESVFRTQNLQGEESLLEKVSLLLLACVIFFSKGLLI